MYSIYHIPGKKIGVTRNLKKRVTQQQGYSENEYEVLYKTDDINKVSTMELELQKRFGYKVDRQSYKNLINKSSKMKLNVTTQTTTFPMPLKKLKGNLMDNKGLKWETSEGSFEINKDTTDWILKNAMVSMYNNERCYIYNKALSMFINPETKPKATKNKELKIFKKIRSWAEERGLYAKGDPITQYVKLQEEAGELAQALLKDDQPEVIDAIGDMVVVLTNLAHQRGVSIEQCVYSAYDVISKRKGKMINGTFVKETL